MDRHRHVLIMHDYSLRADPGQPSEVLPDTVLLSGPAHGRKLGYELQIRGEDGSAEMDGTDLLRWMARNSKETFPAITKLYSLRCRSPLLLSSNHFYTSDLSSTKWHTDIAHN